MKSLSKFAAAILMSKQPTAADISLHFNLSEEFASALETSINSLYQNKNLIDFSCGDKGTYKDIKIDLLEDKTITVEIDTIRTKLSIIESYNNLIINRSEAMYESSDIDAFKQNLNIIINGLTSKSS